MRCKQEKLTKKLPRKSAFKKVKSSKTHGKQRVHFGTKVRVKEYEKDDSTARISQQLINKATLNADLYDSSEGEELQI